MNNKKVKKILTKKFLIEEYIKKQKSYSQIIKETKICFATIRAYLKKYNIPIRMMSASRIGKKNGNYKHGEYCKNKKYYCKKCGKEICRATWKNGTGLCLSHVNLGKRYNKEHIFLNDYPLAFNDILKEKIKERDNYTCQLCGITEKEHLLKFRVRLSIHHIDYDKKNNEIWNLITLCTHCHMKTNANRIHWARKLYKKLNIHRLHLCCGDVFLLGFENLDKNGILSSSIKSNPNITVLSKYYKRRFHKKFSKRKKFPYIIDKKFDILRKFPFKSNSINQIVMICAIEHFTEPQAKKIIKEIYRVLKTNGELIIDFPDIKKDVELYYDTNPEFLSELIHGNQKDEYSVHHWSYTKSTFIKLLGKGWKQIIWKNVIKHSYPMIGCVVIKK